MRLLLDHPGVAQLSCDACQKYVVAVPVTGRLEYNRITNEPIERPADVRTPCAACPKCAALPADKQNPTNGRNAELSAKNRQTLRCYWQFKAAGAGVEIDAITRRNFGLIERELFDRDCRERQLTNQLLRRGLFKD